MQLILVSVLTVALTSHMVLGDVCKPGVNCKLPDCRCWNDPLPPGGFEKSSDIPMMVILSFQYALNSYFVVNYTRLFEGIANPNKCQPTPSFFVQVLNSDVKVVRDLYNKGYDIGVTAPTSQVPSDWDAAYRTTKNFLTQGGIPESQIIGSRGPEFQAGGDKQLKSMLVNNLTYDSTCVTMNYMNAHRFLWPYTYDFVVNVPQCVIGKAPESPFPGKWQFLNADLEFEGHKCAAPSGCADYIKNADDAFRFLYYSFSSHFNQYNRAPFLLTIDPTWVEYDHLIQGTVQFLQFLQSGFKDVWMLSHKQALAWIQNPVNASSAASFEPWMC